MASRTMAWCCRSRRTTAAGTTVMNKPLSSLSDYPLFSQQQQRRRTIQNRLLQQQPQPQQHQKNHEQKYSIMAMSTGSGDESRSSYWRLYSSSSSSDNNGDDVGENDSNTHPHHHHTFQLGDKVHVEIVSFGPLGASVEVIGIGHNVEDIIPEEDPPLGYGLITQQEIAYFRQSRSNVDVVKGEVLQGYVERIRDGSDGKLAIGLRSFGGKAKAQEIGEQILQKLEWTDDGTLPIGDKSSPAEISMEFPGTSKSTFKKAVSALYKQGLVQPGPKSISLIKKNKN